MANISGRVLICPKIDLPNLNMGLFLENQVKFQINSENGDQGGVDFKTSFMNCCGIKKDNKKNLKVEFAISTLTL